MPNAECRMTKAEGRNESNAIDHISGGATESALCVAVATIVLASLAAAQTPAQPPAPAQPQVNGVQVSDATDTENHALGGMIEGPIAIQIHGGLMRWQPGGFWRWRNNRDQGAVGRTFRSG